MKRYLSVMIGIGALVLAGVSCTSTPSNNDAAADMRGGATGGSGGGATGTGGGTAGNGGSCANCSASGGTALSACLGTVVAGATCSATKACCSGGQEWQCGNCVAESCTWSLYCP